MHFCLVVSMHFAVSLTMLMHQVEHIAFGDKKHSFAAW